MNTSNSNNQSNINKQTSAQMQIKSKTEKKESSATNNAAIIELPKSRDFESTKTHFSRKHIDMIDAVITFTKAPVNVNTTNSIPAFADIINALIDKRTELEKKLEEANIPATGGAIDKMYAKKLVALYSSTLMQSVKSYALTAGKSKLFETVNHSRSSLLRMPYTTLVAKVQGAIAAVNAVLPELVKYNITQESIELWQEHLASLIKAINEPKFQHGEQDKAKDSVQDLLRGMVAMLTQHADDVARQFAVSKPDYYYGYRYARKLRPLTRHTKFRVTVTNDLEQPVIDAVITQDGTTNRILTDMNGQANLDLQMVEAGEQPIYSFTITKGSKSTNSGLIEIKRGQTVSRSYQIAPDGFIIPEHQPQQAQKAYVKR